MNVIAMSDVGKVRTINQDYVRYAIRNENECLVVLCDGMGGHNAGEVASQLACDDIIEHYLQHDAFQDADVIRLWMNDIVNHAHQLVKKKSFESDAYEGMGTTIVLALVKDDTVYISHVGDSRAYLLENENFYQLTKDDTLVNALVESGSITEDEALVHPQKNILIQAVGVSDFIRVSFIEKTIHQGCLLICSDGLYNSLQKKQIIEILNKKIPLQQRGEELMSAANTYGGKDNIGFALIEKGADDYESDQ